MSKGLIKVIYLDHSNDFSGGQKSLLALLTLIDRSQIEPVVIIDIAAKKMESELKKLNIKFYKINFYNIKYLEYALVPIVVFNLLLLIKKLKIDLLHCNTFKSGLLGSILTLFLNTPLIFRARLGILFLSHGILDKIIFTRAHLILANSHYVKQTFTERFGESNKVSVVYNPLVDEIILKKEVQSTLSKQYFNNSSVFYFGVISRVEPFKRLHDVVDAAKELVRTRINFKILFIGAKSKADGDEYFNLLQSRIKENQLQQFFEFTDYISDIHEVTSLLNCVLLCTEGEALSRGVYESQLLGVPIIASDSGGNPELIVHNETGLLFRPGDTKDLAEKMNQIMNDKTLSDKISVSAKAHVKNLFANSQTIDREISNYQSLMSK